MDLMNYFGEKKDDFVVDDSHKYNKDLTIAERHAPAQMSEFLGNYTQMQEINQWLSSADKVGGLLVAGPTGCGKTTLVSLACKKYGKSAYILDSSHKRTRKEMNDFFQKVKHFTSTGIMIIDDMETLVSKSDSASMSELSKWALEESTIRVIYVTNSVYLNKMSVISTVCKTIQLEYPPSSALFAHCLGIAETEGIYLSDIHRVRLKEMIASHREPRSVINNLHMIDVVYNSSKDIHMDIYDTYRTLLDSNASLEKKLRYFAVDSGTIPIIFQENYVDFAHSLSEKDLVDMSRSMSIADMYHKKMFTSCSTLCVDTYGCLSCVFPVMYMHPDIKKDKVYKSPRFGLIWTKQSAMYQKKKYWSRFQEHYTHPITDDCMGFMNDIYKKLTADYMKAKGGPQKEALISFLGAYGITNDKQQVQANSETAFDLYNSYNVQVDVKSVTKKAFVTMFKTCVN